jgi:mannose-6-phosphate isomerase-like protein (cupin superfamily)
MKTPISAALLAGNVIGSVSSPLHDSFVVTEWQDPGGPPGEPRLIKPLHVHYRDDEAWYVLDGALHVQLGDQEIRVPAGAAVFAPRGTPHTFWTPDAVPVRYLRIVSANIYRLIQEIQLQADRTPEFLRPLFREYDSDLL